MWMLELCLKQNPESIIKCLSIFGIVYVLTGIAPQLTLSTADTGQLDLISKAPKADSNEAIHFSLFLIDEWLAVWPDACSSAHCANF